VTIQHWHVGSNAPGFLPNTSNPDPGIGTWEDATGSLVADLEHERDLINDADGDINDADLLDEAAREVDQHRHGEGIELVLRDSTGQDRAFWLQDCTSTRCEVTE
jgi:hypothetical protein